MGYDLHITRKKHWSDTDGPTISFEEWRSYVESDPEIIPDPENEGPENFILLTHPERWPLWWDRSGEVYTKNPDHLVIAKLVQIARTLNARVLGDDDEIYGVDPSDPTITEAR